MARIRTVKPEFWGHRKTAKVSREARLLFLGLLNLADDEGRLLASTKSIDGALYLHDEDVTAEDITSWMKELEHAGFVALYEVDHIRYCQVGGFQKHQKVSHPSPSRFPAPCEGGSPESLRNDSRVAPEDFVPEVEQGTGNGNREKTVVAPNASTALALVAPEGNPASTDAVSAVFAAWVESTGKTDRTVLDAKRRRLIVAALKSYPLDDVLDAVRGWKRSKFHNGANKHGKTYNALDLLLRDAEHIEAFRDMQRHPQGEPVPERLQAIVRWLQSEETG